MEKMFYVTFEAYHTASDLTLRIRSDLNGVGQGREPSSPCFGLQSQAPLQMSPGRCPPTP